MPLLRHDYRPDRGWLGRVSPQDWDGLLEIALLHGVGPLLVHHLEVGAVNDMVPERVREPLREERRLAALQNLRNGVEFGRVARALHQAGVPVIALKGLHLAELVYGDISLRPMSDVDILVPRLLVEKAALVMGRLDYEFPPSLASSVGAMLPRMHHIGVENRHFGLLLELHWSLSDPPDDAALVEEIWRSAVPGRLAGADVLIMPPEFVLFHVCAHLACNHTFAFSLRALCDIAALVRCHPALDWNTVVRHARDRACTKGVGAALRLAHEQLGARIPRGVLEALEADKLHGDMLDEALQHLCECVELPAAPNFIGAACSRNVLASSALVWKRIFIPRAELALLYGISVRSPRLILCYALRIRDLFRRYTSMVWAFRVSDPTRGALATEYAIRHERLVRWVREG